MIKITDKKIIQTFSCLSKVSFLKRYKSILAKKPAQIREKFRKLYNDKENSEKSNLTQIIDEYDEYSYENLEIELPYFAVGLTSYLYYAKTKKGKNLVVKIFKDNCIADYSNEIEVIEKVSKTDRLIKVYYNGKVANKSDPNYNRFYIVLERAEKGDLAFLLEEKEELTENEAKDYIIQIIEAVEALRSIGFIHRDIKPDNILLMTNKTIKLTDFGYCDEITNFEIEPIGSPGYIPPELYIKRNVIPEKVDVYSIGITCFILVTGKFPFKTVSEKDIIYNLISKGNWKKFWAITKKSMSKEFSKEFKNMIENLLCFNPEKRYTLKQLKNCTWIKI